MVKLEYKDIGDTLSDAEFNAIAYLIKKNFKLFDTIDARNPYVEGNFADYEIDLDKSTIIDKGVLITNRTLESLGTVKLINPVWSFAEYKLVLSVYHISDVNIDGDDSNIERTTLEVTLKPDVEVPIPFEQLGLDYVVEFNARVNIDLNTTEAHGLYGLSLHHTVPYVLLNNDGDIYANLTDYDGTDLEYGTLSGEVIHFFEKYNEKLAMSIANRVIKTADTNDVYACIRDADDGSRVAEVGNIFYFYEKLVETYRNFTATPEIVKTGDTSDFTVKVIDEDGNVAQGVDVHFYEAYEEGLRVRPDSRIIKTNDTNEIYGNIIDVDDGSMIAEAGTTVHFHERIEESFNQLKATPDVIRTDHSAEISVRVSDEDGEHIANLKTHFFEKYDEDLRITCEKVILKNRSNEIYTTLCDAGDGSRVAEKGIKVHFFEKTN